MPTGVYERTAEHNRVNSESKKGHYQIPNELANRYLIHCRAGEVLPRVCALADETCKGPLQAAFRHDVPAEFVRYDERGCPFYVGPDLRDGYWRLCQSHHKHYDREYSRELVS